MGYLQGKGTANPKKKSFALPLPTVPLLKNPPSPSPSPSTPPSLPHSQSPKPRRPSQNTLKKKKKSSVQTPSPLAPPVASPIFQSPVASDSLAIFDSLFVATVEAGTSLDLATLLRSFCDAGALTLFSHISSPDAAYADLAVRALCSAARLDDACALLRRLSSSSSAPVLPDAFTYNFLIRRLARFRPVSSIYAFNRRASPLLQHPTQPRHLHHPHQRRLPRAQPS